MLSRLIDRVMRRPSVIALALIVVFVAAGTVYAASRGASWRLGYNESLNGFTTGVTGSNPGDDMFSVSNASSSGGSRAIHAENDSNTATMYVRNTGSGPAADFVVPSGEAPFTVNRKTKITNLNADLLDGLEATTFLRKFSSLGATQSGVWALGGATGGNPLLTINYKSALPAAIAEANTHYVIAPNWTTDCPGLGQAAAGHLCVYERFHFAMTVNYFFNPEDYVNGSGTRGFAMYMTPTDAAANALGVWSVTAPTSLASVSSHPLTDSRSATTAGR